MKTSALLLAALLAGLACAPSGPYTGRDIASPAAAKKTATRWTCSGHVFCGDAGVCGYNDEPVSDPGGDVRRAVLRLIYRCADSKGLDADACAQNNLTCREAP